MNLLARDSEAMQRLSALGRRLRVRRPGWRALSYATWPNSGAAGADLLDRAQAHAAEAGLRVTPTVLSEVEATLRAALVDLAVR